MSNYKKNSNWLFDTHLKQNFKRMRSQASEIEEPGKVRKEKKHAQYIQCHGAGNYVCQDGHFVAFATNVLLSSLSVLSVLSGAEIIVENKWQGILHLFQRTELSMFFGYLESIGKVHKRFFSIAFQTLWEKSSLFTPSPLEICPFHTPLPLGISVTVRGGYGYFL